SFLIRILPVSFLILFSFNSKLISGTLASDISKGKIMRVKVTNPANMGRKDEVIPLPIGDLKKVNPRFNENAFVVYDGETQLPAQCEDIDGDGKADNIIILTDLKPNESKTLAIESGMLPEKEYTKRTHAEISVKTGYKLVNGVYTGGEFHSVKEVEMPQDHFAHDALYKFEGPGWESDRVAYRFYLDSRNRNDIFGKLTGRMVLQEVGLNDLVSDSRESYTKMCDWGMDIFKVGESLGLGSIGMMRSGKVNTVSKVDKVNSIVTSDGPIRSSILNIYSGWMVDSLRFNISSLLSISAGSRLTKTDLTISGSPENIVTGIAKHEGCLLVKDTNSHRWGYIASYGAQSLAGDNLGLVIFFRQSDLIKVTEDSVSYIVELKPKDGKVGYFFGAAWQKELNGLKTEEEFRNYLDEEAGRLSNPVVIEL
ncbi:MAG: DUF4861 domain-containing protein, partial [Syntrophothermus sp.]